MTREERCALVPGDVIRSTITGRLRVVLVASTKTGRPTHLNVPGGAYYFSLVKIGKSWTDPRPTASYDAVVIERDYVTTGYPRMTDLVAKALAFDADLDRRRRAANKRKRNGIRN